MAGPPGRLRRRHRTARPRPRRCSRSRCSTAGSTRRSRSAATSTSPAPNAHQGTGDDLRRRGRRERRRRSWRSRRRSRWSPTSRPTTSTTTARVEAYVAVFDDVPRPDRARRRAGGLRRRPRRRGAGRRGREAAGIRVRRYGRGRRSPTPGWSTTGPTAPAARVVLRHAGDRAPCCGWRCPASTWRSTRSPRCWPGSSSGADREGLLAGLAAFDGVRRRFEFKGRAGGVAVYDDYAHHPTKVAAQLRAARDVAGAGAAGWSWRSSRTCTRAPGSSPREFGAALGLADEVVVLDVYGAREDPEPGRERRAGRRRGAAAAGAGALRAALGRRAGRGGRAGASRRPGDHDGRRATSPCSARRSCWSWSRAGT